MSSTLIASAAITTHTVNALDLEVGDRLAPEGDDNSEITVASIEYGDHANWIAWSDGIQTRVIHLYPVDFDIIVELRDEPAGLAVAS